MGNIFRNEDIGDQDGSDIACRDIIWTYCYYKISFSFTITDNKSVARDLKYLSSRYQVVIHFVLNSGGLICKKTCTMNEKKK